MEHSIPAAFSRVLQKDYCQPSPTSLYTYSGTQLALSASMSTSPPCPASVCSQESFNFPDLTSSSSSVSVSPPTTPSHETGFNLFDSKLALSSPTRSSTPLWSRERGFLWESDSSSSPTHFFPSETEVTTTRAHGKTHNEGHILDTSLRAERARALQMLEEQSAAHERKVTSPNPPTRHRLHYIPPEYITLPKSVDETPAHELHPVLRPEDLKASRLSLLARQQKRQGWHRVPGLLGFKGDRLQQPNTTASSGPYTTSSSESKAASSPTVSSLSVAPEVNWEYRWSTLLPDGCDTEPEFFKERPTTRDLDLSSELQSTGLLGTHFDTESLWAYGATASVADNGSIGVQAKKHEAFEILKAPLPKRAPPRHRRCTVQPFDARYERLTCVAVAKAATERRIQDASAVERVSVFNSLNPVDQRLYLSKLGIQAIATPKSGALSGYSDHWEKNPERGSADKEFKNSSSAVKEHAKNASMQKQQNNPKTAHQTATSTERTPTDHNQQRRLRAGRITRFKNRMDVVLTEAKDAAILTLPAGLLSSELLAQPTPAKNPRRAEKSVSPWAEEDVNVQPAANSRRATPRKPSSNLSIEHDGAVLQSTAGPVVPVSTDTKSKSKRKGKNPTSSKRRSLGTFIQMALGC